MNTNAGRSWFHGADREMLAQISDALGIPMIVCESDGSDYHEVFEKALLELKKKGAEACVFGDIDIAQNRSWNEERCKNTGLMAVHPLWDESRESLVRETVAAGYQCLIKCVHTEQLLEEFLGKVLSESLLKEMEHYGIDICGENGEYHTVVVDGPLFGHPLPFYTGKVLRLEHVSVIELDVKA